MGYIILIVIGTLFCIAACYCEVKNEGGSTVFGFLSGACILFAVTSYNYEKRLSSAIDVYCGKTTFEITYRDSIPIDSVVVFKKK